MTIKTDPIVIMPTAVSVRGKKTVPIHNAATGEHIASIKETDRLPMIYVNSDAHAWLLALHKKSFNHMYIALEELLQAADDGFTDISIYPTESQIKIGDNWTAANGLISTSAVIFGQNAAEIRNSPELGELKTYRVYIRRNAVRQLSDIQEEVLGVQYSHMESAKERFIELYLRKGLKPSVRIQYGDIRPFDNISRNTQSVWINGDYIGDIFSFSLNWQECFIPILNASDSPVDVNILYPLNGVSYHSRYDAQSAIRNAFNYFTITKGGIL